MQDYQVDLYLRQHWHDPRLNHSEITQVKIVGESVFYTFSSISAQCHWGVCRIQPICIFSKYALKTRKCGSSRKCTPGPQEQTNKETFVSILWCCYGMASIFSDPMNRHLAKNLSPDCSFRWSLCVQSQTEVESQGSQNYSRDMHYICDTTIFTQVLDLNDPKLVQAIWKPEVPNQNCQEKRLCKICVLPKYWFLGVLHKYFFLGVLPKCKGGRVPVCDRSKSSTQHQTPRTDSLYAQVSI